MSNALKLIFNLFKLRIGVVIALTAVAGYAGAGQRVKASLTRYLTCRLKLVVNEAKSPLCPAHECVFLGFTFRGNKLRWSEEAFADFQHRVRKLTGRSWGVSMSYRLSRLAHVPQRL